jgi:hypothetical protein
METMQVEVYADREERKKDKDDFMAKMDADQAMVETKRKKDKEDLMAELDAYQAKTEAVLLAMQVMDTSHMEMVAESKPKREEMRCLPAKRWRHFKKRRNRPHWIGNLRRQKNDRSPRRTPK